jgi:hypothetical protein
MDILELQAAELPLEPEFANRRAKIELYDW